MVTLWVRCFAPVFLMLSLFVLTVLILVFHRRLGRWSQVPAGVPRNREKLPISTPKNESNLTRYWDFCEKMWHLSHPRTAILLYELADPQGSRSKGRIAVSGWGKNHIFSKISRFLVKFDSFFGVESGNFLLRKSPQNICGLWRKIETPKKFSGFFREERATFDPKKRVEFKENLVFFSKNVALFSSGVDNSPVGTTTSGICRLL